MAAPKNKLITCASDLAEIINSLPNRFWTCLVHNAFKDDFLKNYSKIHDLLDIRSHDSIEFTLVFYEFLMNIAELTLPIHKEAQHIDFISNIVISIYDTKDLYQQFHTWVANKLLYLQIDLINIIQHDKNIIYNKIIEEKIIHLSTMCTNKTPLTIILKLITLEILKIYM